MLDVQRKKIFPSPTKQTTHQKASTVRKEATNTSGNMAHAECEKIFKAFPSTSITHPEAAAYMLGNLYCLSPEKKVEEAITFAKEYMGKKQTLNLWHAFSTLTLERGRVLPSGNRRSLMALGQNMLRDSHYFQYIDKDELIKSSEHPSLIREVLIALVRKHLFCHRQRDPFTDNALSYDLLGIGGPEENHTYLYGFFSQCETLPLDDITTLSKQSSDAIKIILKDFSSTPHFFAVSARLAECHASLRESIAKDWTHRLATYPLVSPQRELVYGILQRLKQYPEFRLVQWDERVERIQPRGENEALIPAWKQVMSGTVSGGLGYFGLKAAVCLCAAPAALPLYFLAAGATIGYTISFSPTINHLERKAIRKIGSYLT